MPASETNFPVAAPLLSRTELVNLRLFPQEQLPHVLADLSALAAADNHAVLNPTHVMLKDGQIIGYLSLDGLPTVHCWFDSKNKHAADSIKMIDHGQTAFGERGIRDFTVACAEESPFTPHMARLGFERLGTTVLWRKKP